MTVLSAATATAAAAFAAAPAGAAAPPPQPAQVGTTADVDRLYREAEQATEAYDRATEREGRLAGQVTDAQDGLARGQQRINSLRGALGSLAGAQYRSGGVDPAVQLFLSSGPDGFLDRAAALDRAGTRTAGRLRQIRDLGRDLAQERTEAAHRLTELEKTRKAIARHKRTIERKLAEARRLLQTLPSAQRTAYGHPAHPVAPPAPASGLADRPSSGRAAAAVTAVRSALGRPYVWGANGPLGFDCSGLMQWAYAQAGVGLPRTSQQQRYAGRQVPLAQARPGDLVAYRHDASHIAMYAGHGQVIHAPYPGATVRYDPVDILPVSSVTRV